LAPNLAQLLASVWVTLSALLVALIVYRYRVPRVLLHLFILVVPIVVFYRLLYHGSVTPGVVLSIGSTTVRESRELLGDHLLLSGLLAIFVALTAWAAAASWANGVRLSMRALVHAFAVVCVASGAWAAAVYHQHGELHNLNWA
jgi:glucan phosphoethanolaminetransferase (alkaline phosphatase superfamily)